MIGVGQYFVKGWCDAILRLYLFDPMKRPILRYLSYTQINLLLNLFHDKKKKTEIHIM